MSDKQSGTKRTKTTRTEQNNREPAGKTLPARGKRNDTGEAKQQQMGGAKSHPTRNPGAIRKDDQDS